MNNFIAYDRRDIYDHHIYHVITIEPNFFELNTKVTITAHLTENLIVYKYETTTCGDVTPKELDMFYRDYLEKFKVILEKGNKEWREEYLNK